MYKINEIAPDLFRISIFVKDFDLEFNHFLIKDDEPMLYHTGMRSMFPQLLEAVKTLIDPAKIRWIGFSHFEVDECGALNDWLQVAPLATPVCSEVGALVNMSDFSIRSARAMRSNETLQTGKHIYTFIRTPHLPHGWDAGVMFEQTNKTLLCSDLFHQNGQTRPITDSDILESHRNALLGMQSTPLMDYSVYSVKTRPLLEQLAALEPKTLATMHGSSYFGDCSKAILQLDDILKEALG